MELFQYLKVGGYGIKKFKQYHESLGKKLPTVESDYLKITDGNIVKSNPYTNISDLIEYMETLENKKNH
mgnify:CR=1 FL=1